MCSFKDFEINYNVDNKREHIFLCFVLFKHVGEKLELTTCEVIDEATVINLNGEAMKNIKDTLLRWGSSSWSHVLTSGKKEGFDD